MCMTTTPEGSKVCLDLEGGYITMSLTTLCIRYVPIMYENHIIYLAMNMCIITTQEELIVCFDLKKVDT